MKRIGISACVWLAAAALAGCAGGEATYSGEVTVTSPELVAIQPGVEVVADADEPLFYSDGYYFLYRDGMWLRSDSYRGGFARIDVQMVPDQLRRLPEPRHYAHFRRTDEGRAYAQRSRQPQRQQPRPGDTDRYTPDQRPGEAVPRATAPAPQPPEPAHPAQPNPMPEHQQQAPDQARPQGAETGNTPQTGGEARPGDRSQIRNDRTQDQDQKQDRDKDKKDQDRGQDH
jgi:hypothetical protein